MAVLANPKHERFAQELAKGKTQIEAYENAGYQPNPSAASRLADDVKICERVAAIQERAAIRAEVTLASITENLARIAQKAELLDDASGLSVARASNMDIAKLHGLVTDKTKAEVTVTQEQALDALR